MADNYLERRMDDYRSGRLGNPARGSRHITPGPGAPAVAIHLHGSDHSAIVRELRALGARVSFSGPSVPEGNALAQSTGSTFCPLPAPEALARMAAARGRVDLFVSLGDPGPLPDVAGVGMTAIYGGVASARPGCHRIDGRLGPADAARAMMMLAKISTPLEISPADVAH